MRRWNLSDRLPHIARRSRVDDESVAGFIQKIEMAKFQYADKEIINVDETSWRVLNGKLKVIARRGADEVKVAADFDTKKTVTIIAGCMMSGKKLPLTLLSKGKSPACETKYRDDQRLRKYISKDIFINHTESGWSTAEFARRYLSFIHERFENGCLLLWDVHASHRHESVKQAAQEHGICLSFIPAGQTAIWQPLDRRIFGIVKQKAKLRFQEVIIRKGLENVDMIDAIVVLIEVWRSLSEQTIRKAWSHLQ